ncbi:hypothetical protein M9458_009730, partial [Cirrhinus mrigala]
VTWCPVPCITFSLCTSRTPAMVRLYTRTAPAVCTGNRRPSTRSATSCTVLRWSGKTLMLNPRRSPCTLR